MRRVLPMHPIRRADVFVATLQGLWLYGWMVTDFIQRANGTLSPPLSVGVVLFSLGATSIAVPFLVGIAKGRRWGFVGMAILSGMGIAGSFMQSLVFRRSVAAENIVFAVVDVGMLAYCAIRWRQERVEKAEAPRTATLRFTDALVGALGVAWVLGFGGVLVRAMIQRPIRSSEAPIFLFIGLLGLMYCAASLGVGLGRRWGFGAMIVASVFVSLGETRSLFSRGASRPEIVVYAFSLVALVYCTIRLIRRTSDEDRSASASA